MNSSDRNHKQKYLEFLLLEYRRFKGQPKEQAKIFAVPVGNAAYLGAYKVKALNDNSLDLLYHVFKSKRFSNLNICNVVLNTQLIQLVYIDKVVYQMKMVFTEEILDIKDTTSVFDKKPVFKGTIVNGERLGYSPEQSIVYAVSGYREERGEYFSKIYLKI